MTDATYSPAAVSRLLTAVLHPETVEGWQEPADDLQCRRCRKLAMYRVNGLCEECIGKEDNPVNARLDAIAAAFVWATAEEREALIEEAAELLTLDPDNDDLPIPF
jgi:antibiotic biosynthesis monooxygenase (ABM) superfamily enzyme